MAQTVLVEHGCCYVWDYPVLVLGLAAAGGEQLVQLIGVLEGDSHFVVLVFGMMVEGTRALLEFGWVDRLQGLFGHLLGEELLDLHHDHVGYQTRAFEDLMRLVFWLLLLLVLARKRLSLSERATSVELMIRGHGVSIEGMWGGDSLFQALHQVILGQSLEDAGLACHGTRAQAHLGPA